MLQLGILQTFYSVILWGFLFVLLYATPSGMPSGDEDQRGGAGDQEKDGVEETFEENHEEILHVANGN